LIETVWASTKETANMIKDLRIKQKIKRGQPFQIDLNGKAVDAYPGETIAAILLSEGWQLFRHSSLSGEPKGPFCGMGLCFGCLVTVNGHPNIRACLTYAKPGDKIEGQI
jgi:aerobic-type carbon monoxide dehydrogenase small subunit (CoxS/CutS family)